MVSMNYPGQLLTAFWCEGSCLECTGCDVYHHRCSLTAFFSHTLLTDASLVRAGLKLLTGAG